MLCLGECNCSGSHPNRVQLRVVQKEKTLFFVHVTGSPYHFREATLMANLSCVCPTDSVAPLAAFWLEGVALPTVGGLGLVGNVATIIVLRFEYEYH